MTSATRRMGSCRICYRLLFVWLAVFCSAQLVMVASQDDEQANEMPTRSSTTTEAEESQQTATSNNERVLKQPMVEEKEPVFLAADPSTWGSHYDPKGEFCGHTIVTAFLGLIMKWEVPTKRKLSNDTDD
jgi:N-acetylmuramoyl-L-alanine amidase CwlA